MNDFEIMCKRLENGKCCHKACVSGGKYYCAKSAVKKYTENGTNKMKWRSLKAEAEMGDFKEYINIIISIIALSVSFLTFIATIATIEKSGILYNKDLLVGLLICIIELVFFGWFEYKFSCINKWRGYILEALEEIKK